MALTLAFSHEEEILWSSRVRELGVRNLASQVKKLSDFYIQNPKSKTPWQDSEMRSAYELYHHPLNILRLRALWQRVPHLDLDAWSVLDFGCGLGATGASRPWRRLIEVDSATSGLGRSQICDLKEGLQRLRSLPRPWVLVLSYVYTELSAPLDWWKDFDFLVVVEPSTQEDGRRLLQLRETLRSDSWWALHPCTHQESCPLFSASKKDWCHDRFHFQQFDLWKEFESHLPMKNRTLTFSSLILSRERTTSPHEVRVVSDLLEEKGRSRVLVCFDSQKRWMQFLKRGGFSPDWSRGDGLRMKDLNSPSPGKPERSDL